MSATFPLQGAHRVAMAPHILRPARLQEGRVLQRRTGACVTCPVVIPRAVIMQLLLVTNTATTVFCRVRTRLLSRLASLSQRDPVCIKDKMEAAEQQQHSNQPASSAFTLTSLHRLTRAAIQKPHCALLHLVLSGSFASSVQNHACTHLPRCLTGLGCPRSTKS
jgi:hypothetical protein